ncbi:integrator complex subunit 9-like isoform X2 [Photinus pyralis]|nr:integrator complex subunit 9-like isoform X2 [Photinus pyralis]
MSVDIKPILKVELKQEDEHLNSSFERNIFYCLSNDPNKPCHILTFREITLMLDCGLSMQSVLNFLPLSYVYSNRLHNLPVWMPNDGGDTDVEGELRENGDRIFIDSLPEFCPPLDKLIDFAQVDVILISNYLCMMALPFITEGTGFQGKVYATEPTLQIGRLLLEELVTHIEQCPKANFASQWKNIVHKLPYPLNESFKPKSWRQIYNMANVNESLSRIQMVGYNEKIDIYGALQVLPTSSGYNLGSSNWIITSDHEKVVYLSGSSTLTTHPRPMDHHALKNADVLIMTDLTQTPISNPDSMLGLLCVVVSLTLRGGGNALIPCYPSGVIYDLFECLSIKMQDLGVQNCPMFFISPVADMSLAYSNILAEWLSSAKQNRVYVPDEPFPHALLLKNSKLKHFKHIYSEGFSTDFQEPCVVFCGHPSLRFGDVVQFIELWGNNPRNCIVFTEPDFDYIEALAPFQPIQMKVAHCAIDTSLNFTQANKLIKDLKPTTLVVPECYTQPPVSAPTLTELVIENNSDRTLIPYKWGEVINLPLKRKQGQIIMETEVAQKINPIEVKTGISLSALSGALTIKDNVHNMTSFDAGGENKLQKGTHYEWGLVNVTEFLQKLAQEGIIDAKVEPSGNGVMIHLVSFVIQGVPTEIYLLTKEIRQMLISILRLRLRFLGV